MSLLWQRFNGYDAYEEHMCHHKIWSMSPRKRFAFCYTVRKTFEALQLHSPPPLRAHLSSDESKKAIQEETRRWMVSRNRVCTDDIWYWLLLHTTPFDALYEQDPVLKYMLGNISCASPILLDITEVKHNNN